MTTVQALLEKQLMNARADASYARSLLADPGLKSGRSKMLKLFRDSEKLETSTVAQLSKFAYLK
jgi:hypothetical protein